MENNQTKGGKVLGMVNEATGLAGGLIGAMGIGQKRQDRRQIEQQQKLTRQQVEAQKELAHYQKEMQMQMWKDTNYSAEMEELRKAGLNPGLIYGMGGGAGGELGASMSTSAGGGSASDASNTTQAGTNQGMALMQGLMMKTQQKLMEAQADKTEAEADEIRGVKQEESKARTLDLLQGVENKKANEILTNAQFRLTELQSKIVETQGKLDERALEDRLREISWTADKAFHDNDIASNEAFILESTKWERIEQIATETINMQLETMFKQSQIDVNQASIEKMSADIVQAWEGLSQGWTNIDINKKDQARKEYETVLGSKYKTVNQSLGRVMEDAIDGIWTILGKRRPNTKRR